MTLKAPKRIYVATNHWNVQCWSRVKTQDGVEYLRADSVKKPNKKGDEMGYHEDTMGRSYTKLAKPKRKPLPKKLREDAETIIDWLKIRCNGEYEKVVRELLRRAGGG